MAGLFGVATPRDCAKELFYGTDYHSHLAAEWAGIAITSDKDEGIFRKQSQIKNIQFKTKFGEIRNRSGHYGIGVLSNERQPICFKSRLGNFALATDSTILNLDDIITELFDKGVAFSESSFVKVNNTEVISKLIHQKNSIEEGIAYAMEKIDGCCTMIILNENGIYAARDRNGLASLVLGERADGACAVATETNAFPNNGFKIKKFIAPGEIIYFNESGHKQLKVLNNSRLKECIFYHSYFSDPTAMHEGVNVEETRNRCGEFLADMDIADSFKADLVCGVPDSGTGHAIGYANKSGVPFKRALVKYTAGWSRSYMPPTQERREEIAYFKQIAIPTLLTDKVVVLVDDSIRRGTQLKRLLDEKIWIHKPKEVHIRIGSPPQLFACVRDQKDISNLAARRAITAIEGKAPRDDFDFIDYLNPNAEKYQKMVDYMVKDINATSLKFITIDGAIKATTKPVENHCIHCWDGNGLNAPTYQEKITKYNSRKVA